MYRSATHPCKVGALADATLVSSLAAMPSTKKPNAGTLSTNQPHTAAYARWTSNWLVGKASGKHEDALAWEQRLHTWRNSELRLGGPSTAYIPVRLLLLETKADVEADDPSHVLNWEEAHRQGCCIVSKNG